MNQFDALARKMRRATKLRPNITSFLLNPGVKDGPMLDLWKTNCPLKQKNFMWL
jgi:hypothetical protein